MRNMHAYVRTQLANNNNNHYNCIRTYTGYTFGYIGGHILYAACKSCDLVHAQR